MKKLIVLLCLLLLVSSGFAAVEQVSEWREENLEKLHLIVGMLLIALGVAMVLRLI